MMYYVLCNCLEFNVCKENIEKYRKQPFTLTFSLNTFTLCLVKIKTEIMKPLIKNKLNISAPRAIRSSLSWVVKGFGVQSIHHR